MHNTYHFVTHWRVEGTAEAVYDLLDNPPDLVRWWPSVYLAVEELPADAAADGTGRVYRLFTKGWLPYRLRWTFRVTEKVRPTRMALEAWGDFVGRGVWTIRQEGSEVDITYDWDIVTEKPLLKRLSWLFRPMFEANHRWAMHEGEISLRRELARQQALKPA
jgi:hypothetical protein